MPSPVHFILLPVIALAVAGTIPAAPEPAAVTVPVPTSHSVPCSGWLATGVVVRWHISAANSTSGRRGRRRITRASVLRRLRRQICSTWMVRYHHPVAIACPAAEAEADYDLRFLQGRRVVLAVGERAFGCRFLWIVGHRNLGSASLSVLLLPPGVPTPPGG